MVIDYKKEDFYNPEQLGASAADAFAKTFYPAMQRGMGASEEVAKMQIGQQAEQQKAKSLRLSNLEKEYVDSGFIPFLKGTSTVATPEDRIQGKAMEWKPKAPKDPKRTITGGPIETLKLRFEKMNLPSGLVPDELDETTYSKMLGEVIKYETIDEYAKNKKSGLRNMTIAELQDSLKIKQKELEENSYYGTVPKPNNPKYEDYQKSKIDYDLINEELMIKQGIKRPSTDKEKKVEQGTFTGMTINTKK